MSSINVIRGTNMFLSIWEPKSLSFESVQWLIQNRVDVKISFKKEDLSKAGISSKVF